MNRKSFLKNSLLGSSLLLLPGPAHHFFSGSSVKPVKITVREPQQKNICATCGTRYATAKTATDTCPICTDERQYVGDGGQTWLSYNSLAKEHSIKITKLQENLYELKITPDFAIGQKALLVLSKNGNVLWDCIPYLDEQTITYIKALGGIKAIAISHPHYYSLMAEWAAAFNCPIYLHHLDKQWIQDKSKHLQLWEGNELQLWDGMKVVHTGGHFDGSTVMHLPHHGNGTLLTGDTLYVARDRRHVSMMYSYPNLVPLPKKAIEQIRNRVEPLEFDTIHGAFDGQLIATGAKDAFRRSVKRYLKIFEG
ncbi:MBL fold metallo-hydrolase [uncultured Pontibacter sp.]|uniref:MBL fold metallo-hydrolase n=1 Tax=uncultured Pontibacter sp. TaxID=453356 RepID=UPI002638459A|nr:MBL fold metallo-hydrolase [uncultured Pontibacter sp.]